MERTWAVVIAMGCACSESRARIEAVNFCTSDESRLTFQGLFPIHYSKSTIGPFHSRQVYSVDCDRFSKECTGVRLDLDGIEQGKPLGFLDLNLLSNVEITSEMAAVTTVKWGALRTFTVDAERGIVSYLESNEVTYGRGEAHCKVGR